MCDDGEEKWGMRRRRGEMKGRKEGKGEGRWHGASPSEGRMCSLGGGVKSGRMGVGGDVIPRQE